ncbi:hypothetical protein F2Q69_00058627 [Brassica cretica]|uniref:Uncharacterized protein n=1 Tax=Brassica cretica TaxID=69181 RepID=A0A8S9RCI2_BRACR|nr:hypothetical protein F2Q69_00058627 [Brassica cretica]
MGQPDKTMSVNGQELFTSSVCLLLSSVTLIRDVRRLVQFFKLVSLRGWLVMLSLSTGALC